MSQFDEVPSRLGTFSTQWDYIEDRFGAKDLLPFSISDMDFPLPEGTRDVLAKAAEQGLFGYTRWNHSAFKGAIVRWYQQRFACELSPETIVYSPSVIYSLSVMLQVLSSPGEKVMTLTPCYDAFFAMVKNNKRKLVEVAFEKRAGQFAINFAQLEKCLQVTRPKIFLLCNPHNPTGRSLSKIELETIIALCNQYQVALLADEIHMDVRRLGVKHLPLELFADQIKVPYASFSSASKSFNAPGVGGAYGIIADEKLRAEFLRILKGRDGLSSISYFALLALRDCYQNQAGWLDELNLYIDENMRVFKEIIEQGAGLHFEIPAATYLGWLDVSSIGATKEQLQAALIAQKVAIMPGETYGKAGQGYLRFNFGGPRAKIIEGAKRLVQALNSLQ